MRTDYIAHNEQYKRRKAEGRPGWQDSDTLKETLDTLEEIFQSEYVPRGGRLLELGCGAGDLTLWLAGRGYDAYGVDIAPTAIDWAREKALDDHTPADFRVGSVVDLNGYPDGFFDVVLDGHCFHCIIGDDRNLFLASARRVLKPNGVLLVLTMCGEVTSAQIRKNFDLQSRCLVSQGIAVRYIGLVEDILDEIRDAGFLVLNWQIKPRREDEDEDQDELLVWAAAD